MSQGSCLPMLLSLICLELGNAPLSAQPPALPPRSPTIAIHADLTDAPRRILHAEIDIPAHPGTNDLVTPEWIPGAHGPEGPVRDIVGLTFTGNGQALSWRRDPVNTYLYHVDVPSQVTTVHVHLDCIYTQASSSSAILEWEALMMYPADTPVRKIAIQPTVSIPANWGVGTSLKPIANRHKDPSAGRAIEYAPTTVEMLEDSPVMTGLHFQEYALAPAHVMDVVGPTAESVKVGAPYIDRMSHLVREASALLGPPHYRSYRFLVRLQGDHGGGGLEHHESSSTTLQRDFFAGASLSVGLAGLLPHEFTHSWNGKYRRPLGLAVQDFSTPMRNDLLWVYEGLTNYLGDLLGERIGLVSPGAYRAYLAETAANMEAQSGRAWRSIADDTFIAAMPANGGSHDPGWSSWRRGMDYYPEGTLLWLDVDTTIRKLTNGQKSLTDFLHLFLAKGGQGEARVEPYTLAEIENDLNAVAPHDWHHFFQARVYSIQPHANIEGIEQSGYRLTYTAEDVGPDHNGTTPRTAQAIWLSVGIKVSDDGRIADVRVHSAADQAGLAPDQKIIASNGKLFSLEALAQSIVAASSGSPDIELTVQDADAVQRVLLRYNGGLRYPTLVHKTGDRDLLAEIMAPLTATSSIKLNGQITTKHTNPIDYKW